MLPAAVLVRITDTIDPALQGELVAVNNHLRAHGDLEGVQRDLRMIADEVNTVAQSLREQSRLEGERDTCWLVCTADERMTCG
jgi:hypothetical protein